MGLPLHLVSFSEEIYTLRSWHSSEFSQQATLAVWKLQCWAVVSASSEQICCGTGGCPDMAMGSWCRMLCPASSKHTMVHPPCQVWYHWQYFADPCRCAALHSPQAVPASHLALPLCLYLSNLLIHPQLLLLRNVLPNHWRDDTGCPPPGANDANLSQHWAGPWALPWSEQIAQVALGEMGTTSCLALSKAQSPSKQVWETWSGSSMVFDEIDAGCNSKESEMRHEDKVREHAFP